MITLIDLLNLGRTTLSDYRSQHNWVKRFIQPLSPKRRVLIQKYRQLKSDLFLNWPLDQPVDAIYTSIHLSKPVRPRFVLLDGEELFYYLQSFRV